MSEIQFVETNEAAQPLGHYSHAVIHNGVVYVATQLGIVPSKPIVVGSIEEQTYAALSNVQAILHAAGSDLTKVLKITIYLSDIQLWEQVNTVYMQFFKDHKPARGVIPCGTFHKGFQIAIDTIASL
ncbi:MAG: RidA family protein [Simkania sp.]|nr:RidA family protein [Simkania sp.]